MSADLPKPADWLHRILSINHEQERDELMLEAFRLQYHHNDVYRRFCGLLNRTPAVVNTVSGIPYLPVSFFKSERVQTGTQKTEEYFRSSGTTGSQTSRHYYSDLLLYDACCTKGFERSYGSLSEYCVLALLPSYLEQGSSSLVYMVQRWMHKSGHGLNGFFLHDTKELSERLAVLEKSGQRTILIGVTYALLDFAEQFPRKLSSTIMMETGGMKGRRKEMVRAEVHEKLQEAFGIPAVHSEYGMTELFSQAYAQADGIFHAPLWMKVSVREEDDPFGKEKASGVIYVADLANIYSCCFIATEDQGRSRENGAFEVLGRLDHSDVRGCSLMYSGS